MKNTICNILFIIIITEHGSFFLKSEFNNSET